MLPVSPSAIFMLFVPSLVMVNAALYARAFVATNNATASPSGWWSGLEDYSGYHSRYLDLDCQDKHNTSFFQDCCRPRLRSQSTSSAPSECTPSASGTSGGGSSVPIGVLTSGGPSASAATNDSSVSSVSSGISDSVASTFAGSSESSTPSVSWSDGASLPSTSSNTTDNSASTPTGSDDGDGDDEDDEDCQDDDDGGDGDNNSSSGFGFTSGSASGPTSASGPVSDSRSTSSSVPSQTSSKGTSSSSTASAPASSASSNSTSSGSNQTYSGGVATYFTQGGQAGACGQVHQDSDLICAMDQDRYGDSSNASPLCGKQVHITNTKNGKTVTVTVADDCPTCDNANSIDLSVGAFTTIATEEEGEVPIEWYFVS